MADAPDLYGLIGHPVEHSRSPLIHRLFAAQTGQHVEYRLIDAAPGTFEDAVREFRAHGGHGLNVTVPYKADAYRYCTIHTDRAGLAGAVNTLMWQDDEALGDNTDGAGLIRDLERNLAVRIRDRNVLLLGAGGAARGVVGPLLDRGPSELVVANRTAVRAAALAADFAGSGPVKASPFDAVCSRFDLVINATSASLSEQVPPLPDATVDHDSFCYDMVYAARPTAFMRWAASRGAGRCADGIGMLVEQAAESFLLWRGVLPDTGPVLAELRSGLN